MKKNKTSKKQKSSEISPEEAVQFLEDMRVLASERDEATQAISLRIPANVLRAVKVKAKSDGKKYQSLIVECIRKGLKEK